MALSMEASSRLRRARAGRAWLAGESTKVWRRLEAQVCAKKMRQRSVGFVELRMWTREELMLAVAPIPWLRS
jgi:hypothetical protein